MKLDIIQPSSRISVEDVVKIRAESEHGWFTILPKHIDFTTILMPGIVEIIKDDGEICYAGIDEGLFVKEGTMLRIAADMAAVTDNFNEIAGIVEKRFKEQDERDRKLRSMLSKLENDLARNLMNESTV